MYPSPTALPIPQEELSMTLEVLFEVGPRLDRKNAGVCLLAKEVLGPPRSTSVFEKGECPKDSLLVVSLSPALPVQQTRPKLS